MACLALVTRIAAGQTVTPLKLGTASELPGVSFSRIADARALSDDRLLVTDAIDRQAYVLDFAKKATRAIGRQGAGPGEYRTPGRLLAIGGDSTLLVDNFGGRWLVMVRDSIVSVVLSESPAMAAGRTPIGADARGHLIGMKPSRSLNGITGNVKLTNDSSWLVRVERASGRVDTITKFRTRPSRLAVKGPSDAPTSVSVVMNPISTGEQAVMFSDGAIAIGRLDPYRIDWFIGAREVKGPALPFEKIPVTVDEKVTILNALPRSDSDTPRKPEDVLDWPETLPPFLAGGVQAGSDGNVWIRRARSLKHPGTDYDVVDRTGHLVKRLHLPANEMIVAFGRTSLFVMLTDSDDLQHLKRYPLPR
jgi:hypothetical protein